MSFLTPRLFAIAKMVDIEDVVADIGTDHAYLPIYLAKDNKAKKIYACDINEKPLEVAKHNINSFDVKDKIELILSDGISWLKHRPAIHINECIIAGLGSNTMLDILKNDSDQIDCYILASQTSFDSIREWVKKNKYFIEQETIVLDNEILYEVIKVNKFAGTKVKNKLDILFGPILRKEINQLFLDKWVSEEAKLRNLLIQVPEQDNKHKQIQKKLKLLGKFINKELKQNETN
jgi:tRNA (adenine22-N1)-methyltransferase